MEDFTINMPTQIFFGVSALEKLADQLVSDRIGKVLVLFGGGSARKTGNLEEVESALRHHDIAYTELGGQSHATWRQVQAGMKLVNEQALQAVIGIGGSSVMDMAKMIGFGVMHDDLWPYLRQEKSPAGLPTLPIITVPTYPSGGSEADDAAEVDNLETGEHGSLYGVFPKYAALDPRLSMSLDASQTVQGAAVIFIQASLNLLGSGNPVANGFTHTILETLLTSMRTLKNHPTDYQARANVMWSSALTTQPILNAGTDGEWTMQFYEDEDLLQQWLHLSYRDALILIFPHWLEMVASQHLDAVLRYFQVMGFVKSMASKTTALNEGIVALTKLFASLGLPTVYSKPVDEVSLNRLTKLLEPVDIKQRPAFHRMLVNCVTLAKKVDQ